MVLHIHSSSCISVTHHYAGVELVEALHCAVAEAVAKVFLDKVGMVQDVISHQWLLQCKRPHDKGTDVRHNCKLKQGN